MTDSPGRSVADWNARKYGAALAFGAALLGTVSARADEGGVSFWLPGQFSSFAATPSTPGFSVPLVYYHASADASASKTFQRGGRVVAGLNATADLLFAAPTYTFADPVAGGQFALSVAGAVGQNRVKADATLTGPGGPAVASNRTDTASGGSDLYPSATLRYNAGNNNWMFYGMADIPVGAYQANRLANIGINHWAIDTGSGYTYLDIQSGREASVVAGLTYNFENHATNYRNGVDSHVDFAASQFLNAQTLIGLVGYAYVQLSGDSGSGDLVGPFKSRVFSLGPQIGYFFPMGEQKGYVNLRGYGEFGAANRPSGWNVWLTFALPL